jgi:nitrite reductase (NADH) large subunit
MLNQENKIWICPVCGYIHYGSQPPDECPVCGAMGDLFELSTTSQPNQVSMASGERKKVVIVGAGVAGVSAAEAIRKASAQVELILVSNEIHLPYYRLNLTRYLAGEVGIEQLPLHPESWYAENNITLLRNSEMSQLNIEKKELQLQNGSSITYDRLILTVGSHPFVPPFPGAIRKNVTTLRTLKDADFILESCHGKHCVCIGGGILGLEIAGGLARQGVDVTVLENQAWLLPRQLNETGSKLFQEKVESLGIRIQVSAQTRELVGDESVHGVLLEDGTTVSADFVIISAGVRSNIDLARQAGLEVKQGIMVDNKMQTSRPDVFAPGDVAEHQGIVSGLWYPSQAQGTVAGMNAIGLDVEFTGLPRSNVLKALGIDLFSIGQISPADNADRIIDAAIDGKYCCFIFRDNSMVGSILLGDTSLSSKVKGIIEDHVDCSSVLDSGVGVNEILHYLMDLG